jgi:hypothetical protein
MVVGWPGRSVEQGTLLDHEALCAFQVNGLALGNPTCIRPAPPPNSHSHISVFSAASTSLDFVQVIQNLYTRPHIIAILCRSRHRLLASKVWANPRLCRCLDTPLLAFPHSAKHDKSCPQFQKTEAVKHLFPKDSSKITR